MGWDGMGWVEMSVGAMRGVEAMKDAVVVSCAGRVCFSCVVNASLDELQLGGRRGQWRRI